MKENKSIRKYVEVLLIFILMGCSPHSLEEFQSEARVVILELLEDLQKIDSRENLLTQEAALKKKFEKLVYVILDARQFQLDHPDAFLDSIALDVSFHLEKELHRIYLIEGGKEVIERAQREAMLRLDGFEKVRKKQKEMRQVRETPKF